MLCAYLFSLAALSLEIPSQVASQLEFNTGQTPDFRQEANSPWQFAKALLPGGCGLSLSLGLTAVPSKAKA